MAKSLMTPQSANAWQILLLLTDEHVEDPPVERDDFVNYCEPLSS